LWQDEPIKHSIDALPETDESAVERDGACCHINESFRMSMGNLDLLLG
jgi:hypothetical protein